MIDEYFASATVLSVTASPMLDETSIIGAIASTVFGTPSAFATTDEVMTGEVDGTETKAGCVSLAAMIGTTATGLDAITSTVEDEMSALDGALTTEEGKEIDV